MYLIEYIKEMTGLSLKQVGDKLGLNERTLLSYNRQERELPLWRLLQFVYDFGLSWAKIGELLERDFPKSEVKRLASSIKPRGRHYEKPDSADDD